MEIEVVNVETPDDETNVIVGYSHFIKTVEDFYEAIVNTVPQAKFGIAFCEASGPRLVRFDGNDDVLVEYAVKNAKRIGAGHSFVIFLKNAYPVNILRSLRNTPELVRIMAATANPLEVLVVETEQGRGIIGVVDGHSPLGVESDSDKDERKRFLRNIGYKF